MFKPSSLRVCQRQCQRPTSIKITRPLSSTSSLCKATAPRKPVRRSVPRASPEGNPQTASRPNAGIMGREVDASASDDEKAGLPPVAILESARLSKALTITTEEALSILGDFKDLGPKPSTNHVKLLLDNHGIEPSMLSHLARILIRCPTAPQRALGKGLLFSGSSLGDPTSTLELMHNGVKYNALNRADMYSPTKHLLDLAHSGLLEAQILQGRVNEMQGDIEKAKGWYHLATTSTQTSEPLIFGASQDEAFVSLGNLLLSTDPEEAQKVFSEAALKYDNPNAYYNLAQLMPDSSENRQIYLLKAASSGILEASRDLGLFYYRKAMAKEKVEEREEGVSIAKEWFLVGADAGYGDSMLKLALILGSEGDKSSMNGWIARAAALKGMEETVAGLRAKLEEPGLDFVSEILA